MKQALASRGKYQLTHQEHKYLTLEDMSPVLPEINSHLELSITKKGDTALIQDPSDPASYWALQLGSHHHHHQHHHHQHNNNPWLV